MVKELIQGKKQDCCDTYSNRDMTGWDLSDRKDMNNKFIHGLCLSHESPSNCLPPKLTGATFYACNLDNVIIPVGNTVDSTCSNRFFKVQDDGQDWLIDAKSSPVRKLGG